MDLSRFHGQVIIPLCTVPLLIGQRAEIGEGRMPTLAIVEACDMVKDGPGRCSESGKDRLGRFGLERSEEALHRRVVVAVF